MSLDEYTTAIVQMEESFRFAEALATITKTLAPGDPLAQLIVKAAEAKVPVKCETCQYGTLLRDCEGKENNDAFFCAEWKAKR